MLGRLDGLERSRPESPEAGMQPLLCEWSGVLETTFEEVGKPVKPRAA